MNVYLCFCPSADPAMPHASLPALAAQLKRDGTCDYHLKDLNLEAFLYFLTPQQITEARQKLSQRLEKNLIQSDTRQKEAQRLLEDSQLPQRIPSVIKGLRDPDMFYRSEEFLKLKTDMKAALRIISLGYDRLNLDKYSLFENFSFNSFADIREALDDEESLMLRRFYRETFIPELSSTMPELVGMSVPYFSQLIPTFVLAEEIRNVCPDTHITLGGPVITWGKSTMTREPAAFSTLIDSFCIGEGEQALSGLVDALKNGATLASIPNLFYFVDGKEHQSEAKVSDIHLEDLATPDYTSMPLEKYLAPERVLSLPLTKGCYYNRCKFCNYAFIKMTEYRERPVDKTIRDIKNIVEQTGDHVFSFESDVIKPQYILEFAEALLKAELDIKWHGVMRFEPELNQEFFHTLASAGCVRMYFGLESGNPRILKLMDKGTTVEVIEKILHYCDIAGIATEVGIFLAYPGESVDEARDSLDLIQRCGNAITRADAGFFRLLKGAPIVDQVENSHLPNGKNPDDFWYTIDYHNPSLEEHNETFQRFFQQIEDRFPNLRALDISEEILILAKYGKRGVQRINELYRLKIDN